VEVKLLPDIVDAAMASGMTKLAEAIKAAGLVETLKGPEVHSRFLRQQMKHSTKYQKPTGTC
jgi:hypothetical protein